ncbi:hypothetical protein ACP4OV_012178 [Aristida adscensionis]
MSSASAASPGPDASSSSRSAPEGPHGVRGPDSPLRLRRPPPRTRPRGSGLESGSSWGSSSASSTFCAETAKIEAAIAQAPGQVPKVEKEVARAGEKADEHAGYISLESLESLESLKLPLLTPQPSLMTNFMPSPSSTPSPRTSNTSLETNFMMSPLRTSPPVASDTSVEENFMLLPSSTPPPVTTRSNTPVATTESVTKTMAPGCVNILMHYGGSFSKDDPLTYDGGEVSLFQNIDKDVMSYFHVLELAKSVGFKDGDTLFYCIPGRSIEGGIDKLIDDASVCQMMKYANQSSYLEVYIEHNEHDVGSDAPLTDATQQDSTAKEEDETWNKRQISYVFALGTMVALVFLLRPLLPAAYDRLILVVIAAIWGIGSFGLPCGLHGTTRWEKNFSRHVGRLVSTLFWLLVIYGIYLLALHVDNSQACTPSGSPLEDDEAPTDSHKIWTFFFGLIGVVVLVGHLVSWTMGCLTGGDRDRDP